MPFSMSGSSNWSYNRFDAFEAQYKKTEEPKAEAEAVEEETLEEGSCGSKGYQEGGEVKCDKCEGKGCDHCDEKGTHKKSEKKGAKPDYLDFDKDGNKDEPMKDALKSKKEVKEENLEENRMAARSAGGYKDDSKKQTDPSKAGFTGISGSIKDIMRQNKEIEAKDADSKRMKKFQDLQKNVDQKKKLKKEELEATGIFTAEEIEALLGKY